MPPSLDQPTSETQIVWHALGRRQDGFFLDIGANDPKNGSQSWLLEERGWRGILVEPQPRLCERLRQARPRSQVFQVACGAPGHAQEMPFYIAEADSKSSLAKNLVAAETKYVATVMVPILTVDELLAKAGNPHVDFVSIDVEGTQLEVLRGFSLQRFRPSLLLIEDHLHTLAVHRYIKAQAYRLVKRTGLNNWYVPREAAFAWSGAWERLRLWKKVWLNTPFRKLRVARARRKAAHRA